MNKSGFDQTVSSLSKIDDCLVACDSRPATL
jgi:hypothetical protein